MQNHSLRLIVRKNALFMMCAMGMLICFATEAKAQKKDWKQKIKNSITLKLTSNYDDNILKYSDKYIQRFLNQEDQGRFHIITYDDVTLAPQASFSSTVNWTKNQSSKFNVLYKYYAYMGNGDKNRSYLSLGLQHRFKKNLMVGFSYSYIPKFYVRHLRDDDWVRIYGYSPETFQAYSFSKDSYGFDVQNTFFNKSRLRISYDYALYFHNEHFTEYDSRNSTIGANLRQKITKDLSLEAGYSYTMSNAKGFDQAGETKESSDDSDGSYNENSYDFRVIWNLPKLKGFKHSIDLGFSYMDRDYTTKKTPDADQLHSGREDDNFEISGSYSIDLSRKLSIELFYNRYLRNATSVYPVNREYISDEKDYRQNQIGLTVIYNFDF
ncbi:MAG: hypothetical protein GX587_13540 [Bacteroidales bacterium]|nr:hypothetical protein [Bacteroidales bacterium]